MEPVAVLIVLPTLVGVAAALCFHDAKSASLAGALASVLAVSLAVSLLGGMDHWTWLAAFMVSPLTVGCAVAAVVICQGRSREHHRKHRREA